MAEEDRRQFLEKVEAFIQTHQQIVADFEGSLANARHFLELAGRSMEQEPEETVSMLEQIKEIDLLGKLATQYEEFQAMSGFLRPPNTPVDDARIGGTLNAMENSYQKLIEESEKQMDEIDRIVSSLQNAH